MKITNTENTKYPDNHKQYNKLETLYIKHTQNNKNTEKQKTWQRQDQNMTTQSTYKAYNKNTEYKQKAQ